jgi:hypothetical protein
LSFLIHFVGDMNYGCEMSSGYWLLNAPNEFGRALMAHSTQEMRYLTDLISQLIGERDNPHVVLSPLLPQKVRGMILLERESGSSSRPKIAKGTFLSLPISISASG